MQTRDKEICFWSYSIAYAAIEACVNAYIVLNLVKFGAGENSQDDDAATGESQQLQHILTFVGGALMFIANTPIAFTTSQYALYGDPAPSTVAMAMAHHSEDEHGVPIKHKHHHHSVCHRLFDAAVIGLPFALLGFAAVLEFIESDGAAYYVSILVAAACGVFYGKQNMALHANHIHAKESLIELLKQLSPDQRPWMAYLAFFIIFGHLTLGFLAGNTFLDAVNLSHDHFTYMEIIPIILAIPVAFFEGNTDARSIALTMVRRQQNIASDSESDDEENKSAMIRRCQRLCPTWCQSESDDLLGDDVPIGLSRYFLMMSSFLHGLGPVLGLVQFVGLCCRHDDLGVEMYARLLILAALIPTFQACNAYGFYEATKRSTRVTVDAVSDVVKPKLVSCVNWFHTPKGARYIAEVPEDGSVPGASGTLPQQQEHVAPPRGYREF